MTKTEQTRLTTWRLKMLVQAAETSRNVARTCRHCGISRQAFYTWKKRYDAHGMAGLCDRARRPHRSPRATPAAVVSKILYLRQTYHFGPGKIADHLKRFHHIAVARSSVHRIWGGMGCTDSRPTRSISRIASAGSGMRSRGQAIGYSST